MVGEGGYAAEPGAWHGGAFVADFKRGVVEASAEPAAVLLRELREGFATLRAETGGSAG